MEVSFVKKPKVTHNSSKIAKKRNKIANQLPEDEIFVQTVHNALQVPNASLVEKLTFTFTSIPEARIDFPHAKRRVINILDLLAAREEITSEEVALLKQSIENINSLENLLAKRTGIFTN